MNLPFIKNLYFGQELSEDEIKDIPHPRAELHFHVMYKNLQVSFDIWQSKLAFYALSFFRWDVYLEAL